MSQAKTQSTTLGRALQGAGYVPLPPPIDLKQIAKESVQAAKGKYDPAKDHFFNRVRGDARLLWELFEPFRAEAARRFLIPAADELRQAERPVREIKPAGGALGQISGDNQTMTAQRTSLPPALPQPVPRPSAARASPQAAMRAVSDVTRLSLLDTFKINGQSIGDLTAGEARGWSNSRARDVRFVRLLVSGLEPDVIIRKARSPKETQELYDLAEKERRSA